MLENACDLEHAAMSWFELGFLPVILLLDFAAAFPSISRAFIMSALRAAPVPRNIRKAVAELYKDNAHFFYLPQSF